MNNHPFCCFPSPTVGFISLGCRVNQAETDQVIDILRSYGWRVSSDLKACHLIVVNTCTVTAEGDKKSRKEVRRALNANSEARVLVTGCSSALHADFYAELSPRVMVVSKPDLYETVSRLAQDGASAPFEAQPLEKFRCDVKIQDGCNHACTYCIVHTARGRSCSVSPSAICEQVSSYVKRGAAEIILTGIDLGSYSFVDQNGAVLSLVDLLSHLYESVPELRAGKARVRLSSIEPQSFSDELVQFVSAHLQVFCAHFHIPLQSGSSRVLRDMGRLYTAEDYYQLIARIREALPDAVFTTDIIVGFPGETEADFQATCDLAQKCGFSKIHVFPYSKRPGTPAAVRPDQVDNAVKESRCAHLRDLSDTLREEIYRQHAGREERVVVEELGVGMTESFYHISVDQTIAPGTLLVDTLPDNFLRERG